MQAVFLLSIFTMVMAIIASIMSNGTSNSRQLQQSWVAETRQFFENVDKIVNNDITVENLEANPNNYTDIPTYFRNMKQIAQIAQNPQGDPGLDIWGEPYTGYILTKYENLASPGDAVNNVGIPVTAFAIVSGGPNRKVDTSLTTVTSLTEVLGLSVPLSGTTPINDDIIYTFDNRSAQERNHQSMVNYMRHIGTAALREVETRLNVSRTELLNAYKTKISNGEDADINMLDITQYPDSPNFRKLDSSTAGMTNRRALGVDGDFEALEAKRPKGGFMQVTAAAPADLKSPLILTLTNNATKPTPWGPGSSLKYTLYVNAISSTVK